MKLWIFLFCVVGFWPPVQPDTSPNVSMTNHQTFITKLSPTDDGNLTLLSDKKEEEKFVKPERKDQLPSNDKVSFKFESKEVTDLEQSDDQLEGYKAFCEELAKNISYLFEEKKFGKDDRSHLIYSLYKDTLKSCERLFTKYANLAFDLVKDFSFKCEKMLNTYSTLVSRYCMKIMAECVKQFNEKSSFASAFYDRLYNDYSQLILELYEEPANSFWKLFIDYKDMALALYNQTILELEKALKHYSEMSSELYKESKFRVEYQYAIAKEQISLTYCLDCTLESPLFYNLAVALILIHVHLKGLNVITLIYLSFVFFAKSKLFALTFLQFVEPIHSALIANSKIYFSDYQMPNDQVYLNLLILHFIASIFITLFVQKKNRDNLVKFLTISIVGLYIKGTYIDGKYSSASSFNLDDLKYSNNCLDINHLESNILLIFVVIICLYGKSERIANSKTNSKLGSLTKFLGGYCARIILFFIMLTSIFPAFFFLVSKSANANLDFWPYKPSLVC